MAWKIELADAAEQDLDKLDPQMAKRILAFLLIVLLYWITRAAWARH